MLIVSMLLLLIGSFLLIGGLIPFAHNIIRTTATPLAALSVGQARSGREAK
jgi:hypothetical protein